MMQVIRSNSRGASRLDWLDSKHTFSFADYHDPEMMGYRSLRVINDDRVIPGAGFGTHPHRDMEIITVVLEGAIEHKDSMGTGEVLRPGEVQRMTAGTGVRHSEFNPSKTEGLHLLQIWILPEKGGLTPSYEQKAFPEKERRGRLRLVASRDGRDGSLTVHQDVDLYTSLLSKGDAASLALRSGRGAFIQVARGDVRVGSEKLGAGDGAVVEDVTSIDLKADSDAEVLVFDLA